MAIVYHKLLNTWIFFFFLLRASCENVLTDEQMRTRGGVKKATKKVLFDSNTVEIPDALRNLLMNSPDRDSNREEATVCSAKGRHKACPDDLDGNAHFNSYKQLTVEGSTFSIYCCDGPEFQKRCCNLDDFRTWYGEPGTKPQPEGGKPAIKTGTVYEIPIWTILVIVMSVILTILIIIEPIVVCCIAGCLCIKSSQTTGSTIAGGHDGNAVGYSETSGSYSGTAGSYGGTAGVSSGIGESNGGTAGGYGGTGAAPTNNA